MVVSHFVVMCSTSSQRELYIEHIVLQLHEPDWNVVCFYEMLHNILGGLLFYCRTVNNLAILISVFMYYLFDAFNMLINIFVCLNQCWL